MDPSWLGGAAAVIASAVGVAAWFTGRKQNQRSSALDGDRIRSEANDELIQNLRADNADLRLELAEVRGTLTATRARLEQVSADCKTCQEQLDELASETYGRRGMYRPNPEET